jgi:rfaE bifunctional protein kinase chain/domain
MMDVKTLNNIMDRVQKAKVLVIGDIGLDSYIVGDVKKISPEAPVPVVEAKDSYYRLGLAANVANNVKALGAECRLIGLIGADLNAKLIKDELKVLGLDSEGLVVDEDRPTTHKTRVLASRLHHVVRIDKEDTRPLNEELKNLVIDRCKEMISWSDIVIMEDYAKGLFNDGVAEQIIELCNKAKKPVFVDPSRYADPLIYKSATLLKPNLDESKSIANYKAYQEGDIEDLGKIILKNLGLEYLVITRGKAGMSIFDKKGPVKNIPAFALEVFDVSGAGDTVIATLALAYVSGADIYESALFANAAAAIVVAKVGTAVASRKEIMDFFKERQKGKLK